MTITKQYILECLDKYCRFEQLSEETFEQDVIVPLKAENCFENWTWDNGVTKGVIIFKDFDFVVKIPFEGSVGYIESHYETPNGRWIWSADSRFNSQVVRLEGQDEFTPFDGADTLDNWNYCAVESYLTEMAVEKGLIQCFAATEYFGEAKGHPIYFQEKCCMFSDASTSENKDKYKNRTKADYDSLTKIREKISFWEINNDWVLDFLIYWGEETLHKLAQFLFDYDIGDLHNGNIGYHNGVPCLVDYSSYRG
jgi:hypothetical protein